MSNYSIDASFADLVKDTYLELYNAVLKDIEVLSSKTASIRSVINRVNRDICYSDDYFFREREYVLTVPANTERVEIPFNGVIKNIYCDSIELRPTFSGKWLKGVYYSYCEYSVLNDTLLVPKKETETVYGIVYLTNYCCKDVLNADKNEMSAITDYSICPGNLIRDVIVFGACLQLKKKKQHQKYEHWREMYELGIARLGSKLKRHTDETSSITIFSNNVPEGYKNENHF